MSIQWRRFQRWAAPCGCTATRTVYRYDVPGSTWQASDAFIRECAAHHDPGDWAWSYVTPDIPNEFQLVEERPL